MNAILKIQNEIVEESMFEQWWKNTNIYRNWQNSSLIEPEYKTDDNLINGCQSQFLHANYNNGLIIFTADSDAIMTKGIVGLLIRTFSNQSPQDIIDADTDFINKIGLNEQLSPTRANGLSSMVKQMKIYAYAYLTK